MRAATDGLRTRSLLGRVTVTVLIFVAIMLAVLAVTTDIALRARLEGDLRQRLVDRASFAQVLIDQVTAQDLVDRLEGDGVSVELRTADGRLYGKGPLRPSADIQASKPGPAGPPGGPAKDPASPIRVSGDILQITQPLSDGSSITLIASSADVRRTLSQVRTTLIVAGLVLLALAAAALRPVIGRALRPLDEMTATARSITAGDRGARLRPDRPDTELGRTATAFDAMLDEVEGAEAQARSAEHRLRSFLSDAAHELRTPLAGVQAAAERQLRTDPDRAVREQLSVTVIREARRAGRLVDDLLTMTRIDQGLDLDLHPTSLAAVADRATQTVRLTAPEATISVTGAPVEVIVDADRITQVITNLLDNAVHAAGPATTIVVTIGAADGLARVDIADDGPGIADADGERIFERLVRLDEARSARRGGSGLGLSIARGIARAHGGDLRLLPRTPGSGATFRLTLPLDRSAPGLSPR